MALVGAPLTMASIAVLPVLLGLGVDYAIQYQARIADPPTPRRRGAGGARRRCRRSRPRRSRPRPASSCCCSRPVPMVRGFGAAAGGRRGHRLRVRADGRHGGARRARRARGGAAGRWRARRAGRASCSAAARPPAARLGAPAGRLAARVLARGAARARAACSRSGWPSPRSAGSSTRSTEVRSDLQRARPAGPAGGARPRHAAAHDGRGRARSTSSSRARDLTDPAVVALDARVPAAGARSEARYSPENGCGKAALCPALSLPDLFQGATRRRSARGSTRCWTPCRRTSPRR